MIKIIDNKIYLTRGDTAPIELKVMDGHDVYTDGTAVFTMKRNTCDTEAIISKTFVDGKITIEPTDTENLDFGEYRYDVQLTLPNGNVDTVIVPTPIVIMEEVTW